MIANSALDSAHAWCDERLAHLAGDSTTVATVVRRLLGSTEIGSGGRPRRELAISKDGTPYVFSTQATMAPADAKNPSFRLLVEPGTTALSVADQINCSLSVLDDIVTDLAWQDAGVQVNQIIDALFPKDARAVDDWWGGMGIGCVIDERSIEIRGYCNLRNGEIESRWKRLCAALTAFFSAATADEITERLRNRAAPYGVPAGMAFALRDARVIAVRLYVAIAQPSVANIANAGARVDFHMLERTAAQYERFVGPFHHECVTVAYDIPVYPGARIDIPARFKADFDCSRCANADADMVRAWILSIHGILGIPSVPVDDFLAAMTRHFGGFRLDYLSLGFRSSTPELTTYVRPAPAT